MVNQIDLMASFAELLDFDLGENQGIDSRSVLPALLGNDQVGTEILIQEAGVQALRKGNWKYIPAGKHKFQKSKKAQLYNLAEDIGEQQNLMHKEEQRAKEMSQLLKQLVNSKKGIRYELENK